VLGKSVPTVRKALRLAAESDEAVRSLPRKVRRRCWAEDHAQEVAGLKAQGLSVPQIARELGKSEPTIRAALQRVGEPTGPERAAPSEGRGSPGAASSDSE
jgi:DNA-binding NarL/FixJ family response regulator